MATVSEMAGPKKKKVGRGPRTDTAIRTDYGIYDPERYMRVKGSPKKIAGKEIHLRYYGSNPNGSCGIKVKFTRKRPIEDPVQWIVTVDIEDWTTREWECVSTPSLESAKVCAASAIRGAVEAERNLVHVLEHIERWQPVTRSEIWVSRRGWTRNRWKRFWKFLKGNEVIERTKVKKKGPKDKRYQLTEYGQELLDEYRESG